jgi:DNA polymerase III alpha subunit (gram-positive type)
MSDIDIDFSRSQLRLIHEVVREHFPKIKVSKAGVVGPSFRQYLFEFTHEGERFAEYVRAANAYEARYEGWAKFLAKHRIEGWV